MSCFLSLYITVSLSSLISTNIEVATLPQQWNFSQSRYCQTLVRSNTRPYILQVGHDAIDLFCLDSARSSSWCRMFTVRAKDLSMAFYLGESAALLLHFSKGDFEIGFELPYM